MSDPEEGLDTAAPPPAAAHALEEERSGARPEAETEAPKPPPATKLVLVRHAVTEQTGPMLTGRTAGVDLSDDGQSQAKALGERLGEVPVAAVYASPIERTTQTAEAIAAHHALPVRALPGVIEADYGEWTGGK
ncbi:MAG: histidine phosphatase family protein, partial [Acidimicrobiia bacterium]